MTDACAGCLRRSYLLAHLAPRLAGVLGRPRPRPSGVLSLSEEELITALGGSRAHDARRFVASFEPARAAAELARAEVGSVCTHDPGYPDRLRQLNDPPVTLFFSGDPHRFVRLLGGPAVAVVGTRQASDHGVEVAQGLGRGLAAAGVTVVSGLALGIDAAAHRGALAPGGGHAVAVLGNGVDVPYPRLNRPLQARLRAEAALVSELPPGQLPLRWSFPARNRIMAALAQLTVVVEAADRSGSLITATFAAQLGRTVGAVPGRVTARATAGSNRLLRDGAAVVRGAEDVLDELFGAAVRPIPLPAEPDLDPPLRAVLDGVEAAEGVNAIGRRANLSASAVRAGLARLEHLGVVRSDPLGGYRRTLER